MARVLAPLRLIEIDRQEAAARVCQERIDADRASPDKVPIKHGIRQRHKFPMAAGRAGYLWFPADPGPPLVGA